MVPSPSCEAPPEHGHKVLEARYSLSLNKKLRDYPIKTYSKMNFKVYWISRDRRKQNFIKFCSLARISLFQALKFSHNFFKDCLLG